MRLRHRHFNARYLGAKLVLDSRFINQSDNTAVSSWPDRSGNASNADQANASNQPTFQTNELAGNGIVSFDGSNDALVFSSISSVNTALYIAKERIAAAQAGYIIGGNGVGFFISIPAFNEGAGIFDGSLRRSATTLTGLMRSGYRICYTNSSNIFMDGKEVTYAYSSTPAAFSVSRIGDRINILHTASDVALVTVFTSSLSSSARKRLEHAAAFSFKISCN